jgi:serine/threonine protein kinase
MGEMETPAGEGRREAERGLVGQTLAGRYVVGECVAVGERVVRFAGRDLATGGALVIDAVRGGMRASREDRAARALSQRALATSRIRHPNVVRPRDLGVLPDGTPFVVTTRFPATSLEHRVLSAGALSPWDVVGMGCELLSALAAADEAGVTHGALRPSSVLLVERAGTGAQTLVDGFGGPWVATHDDAFVPPDAAVPSGLADVYAAAVVLWVAALGALPVRSPSGAWPRCLPVDVPSRLARVLHKAVSTEPMQRYESALHMLDALEAVRDDLAAMSERDPCVVSMRRPVHDAALGDTTLPLPVDEFAPTLLVRAFA